MTDAISVSGLVIERSDGAPIVADVSFTVGAGEVLALVGESGSGKTTLSLGLLGYTQPGLRIAAGSVRLGDGPNLLALDSRGLRRIRGRRVSYVAQDPSTALDPCLRVASQIEEARQVHGLRGNVEALLRTVGLPADHSFQRRFPHQLSGGQQQRLAIAVALACAPQVVVLDEPTTALDVITQAQLLEELSRLKKETGAAFVYVSHDLAVVSSVADRVAVMYAGQIVETGPTERLLHRPHHPYSLALVDSVPDHVTPRVLRGIPGISLAAWEALSGCAFASRCRQATELCTEQAPLLETVAPERQARCWHWQATPAPEALALRAFREPEGDVEAVLAVRNLSASHDAGRVIAANDVSFAVEPGDCLALVGESGSGKTTIARCLVGLHRPDAGEVLLAGQPLAGRAQDRSLVERRQLQIVFQNPYDSLNPRRTVEESINRALRLFRTGERGAVAGLLELVRLPSRLAARFPHELSGGERQRVAIARALAAQPSVVVCDEITSALDVSVQAVVLELLWELRRTLGLALVLITHDLGVVASVADHVVVLERGEVRERGPTEAVLKSPKNAYTQRLLAAAPSIEQQPETPIAIGR